MSADAPIEPMNSLTPATALVQDIDAGCPGKHQDGSDRSVVVCLFGGLGNQMFQYAAARALAVKTGSRLILDATGFTLPKARRSYALDGYALAAETRFDGYRYPPRQAAVPFPARQLPQWIERAVHMLRARISISPAAGANSFSVFAEDSFDFDPRFWQCGPQTYLVGYWQSERYFSEIADVIRRELTYLPAPDSANARWLARIGACNAVCIHVRRGDYLLPAHFKHHGLCSAGYYQRAVRLMRERVANPQFFAFSDDWAWCREHLGEEDIVVVDANKPDAGQDELRLMAACRHHVIANSSLSWWAAWLATGGGQIVVAPAPWFSHRPQTPDLFPADWIVMSRD